MEQWNKGKKTPCDPYKQRDCDCSTKRNNDGTKGTKHGTTFCICIIIFFRELSRNGRQIKNPRRGLILLINNC